MCFVSVSKGEKSGQGDTYKHVVKDYIHTAHLTKDKLDELAKLLNVPKATSDKWKAGKFHIVHEP
ncbi:MAG TPA: hypothetical protein VMA86_12240 [Acetobacteraceae bacterium]|nr:hypothetical protein [Acetobacteraceae bacterium]